MPRHTKAWASAETVRRDWLRTFVARKTAPKGTAAFLAAALAHDVETVAGIGGNHLAADLLGCDATEYGRAQVLALAQVLAAYEDSTGRTDRHHVRPHVARYLRVIEAQGYSLSTVERRACGAKPEWIRGGRQRPGRQRISRRAVCSGWPVPSVDALRRKRPAPLVRCGLTGFSGGAGRCSQSGLGFGATGGDRRRERVVVPFVLVGVGLGEVGDGVVEGVRAAEVGSQRDAVAGPRVGPC